MLKRFLSAVLALLSLTTLEASTVDSLLISASLNDDGSALVHERWCIDVHGDITEWYQVIGNLGSMDVRNFTVRENGREYISEGTDWRVDRSRSEKAGRCGIVEKSYGYELCWGIGSEGRHVWDVSYTLLGLVQSHDDMDGFNFMFVTRGQSDPPQYVETRIFKEGVQLDTSNSRIWAFGFHGEINFHDGQIVARSSEPFTEDASMIILAGFSKGLFEPDVEGEGSFAELRDEAFEGSSYESDEDSFGSILWIMLSIIALFMAVLGISGYRTVRSNNKRRKDLMGAKRTRDIPWFRAVPVNGSLYKAGGVLSAFKDLKDKNLIAAYIMRLFYKGAFSLANDGKGRQVMHIRDFAVDEEGGTDSSIRQDLDAEYGIYQMISQAAGENRMLEKKEIGRWCADHEKEVYKSVKKCKSGDTIWSIGKDDVQQVFGLKNFLNDFTLINERGVQEVQLWNNYLIFASLYGIADKVYTEIKQVCPNYEQLAGIAPTDEPFDFDLSDVIIWSSYYSRNFADTAFMYEQPSSSGIPGGSGGFGGGASWGGGGGFSGGGSGGGGR